MPIEKCPVLGEKDYAFLNLLNDLGTRTGKLGIPNDLPITIDTANKITRLLESEPNLTSKINVILGGIPAITLLRGRETASISFFQKLITNPEYEDGQITQRILELLELNNIKKIITTIHHQVQGLSKAG